MIIKPQLPVIQRGHPLTKGLGGAWPFFEKGGTTLRDISGKNNNGTLTNMDPSTDWVKTPYGYGLDFDGVDDFINCGAKPNLIFGHNTYDDAFSVLALVKRTDDTAQGIVGWDGPTSSTRGWLFTDYSDGNMYIICYDGADGVYRGRFGPRMTTGIWHSVVGTYDGSGTTAGFRIYIDGKRIDTTDISSGTYVAMHDNSATVNFEIGRSDAQVDKLTGQVANTLVWGKRVLTIEEVVQLYADPWAIYKPSPIIKRYIPVNQFGKVFDITPPTISNFTVASGVNDGELDISFDYSDTENIVDHCEIAIARIDTDLPSGAHTGSETDSLLYNVFKPIYKTTQTGELPAMAGILSGTYSVTLKLPDNGKVYVTVSARDSAGNWANWVTPLNANVKGTGGGGEVSYPF